MRMGTQWRETQRDHNLDASEALRALPDRRFPEWEVTMLSYAAMPMADGWFERQGMIIPARRGARRGMIKRHLPHLYAKYGALRSMSELARYGRGYAMGDKDRQVAQNLHEFVSKAIAW